MHISSKHLFFLSIILLFGVFLLSGQTYAADLLGDVNRQLSAGEQGGGLGAAKDPRVIAAEFIAIALTLVGSIFMLLIIYAGYLMLTDRGEEEKFDKAKSTLRAAVIGLFITLAAYGITLQVGRVFQASTTGKDYGTDPDVPRRVEIECPLIDMIRGKCSRTDIRYSQ